MKSMIVSVLWPCWLWLKEPTLKFLFCSYSASLSMKHSNDRARLLESEWYQALVSWKMSDKQNTRDYRVNTANGAMYTTSVGGSATGKGGDIIILDDPMDPARALSDAERNSTNQWIDLTISTRLDQPQKGAIVLIMQRLHQDDTTGHLLARGGWHHLCLPCPAQQDTEITFPVSGRKLLYRQGAPLWPEREDAAQLERQRVALGSWGYAGQYLQSPAPLQGGIVRREWLRFWSNADLPHCARIVQSWDLTFKSEASSYVCGQVWGVDGPNRYLLDLYRERVGFTEAVAAIRRMREKWPATSAIVIEDKANGPAVIETLRRDIPGVIAYKPEGSKIERLSVVAPQIEAGNVYLPADAPWRETALAELCNFPSSPNDDIVDALSMALRYLRNEAERYVEPPKIGTPEYWEQEAARMRAARIARVRNETRRII